MYNVVFLCSTHGPRMGRNERLTAEISIPILHVRKWMPDPIEHPSKWTSGIEELTTKYIYVKMAAPWDWLTLLSYYSLYLHLRCHSIE